MSVLVSSISFSNRLPRTLGEKIPASTATLAQRWPNVNPYVGPTSARQRGFVNWPNVGPTVARQRWPNVVPTWAQRWHTNVGPTLAQRYANGCMPTLYQQWPNGGCVTGFLWGEPIGHRSVTGWTNSRVDMLCTAQLPGPVLKAFGWDQISPFQMAYKPPWSQTSTQQGAQ